MQILIQLQPNQLAHMTNQQVGAFVAYCFTLKDFAWIKVQASLIGANPSIDIAFDLPSTATLVDSEKINQQLKQAQDIFADMEPYPCNCGCGAFISVSPCYRQAGTLVECPFNEEELGYMRLGNKIACIKAYRTRMGKCRQGSDGSPELISLRECVDTYEKYFNKLPLEEQNRATDYAVKQFQSATFKSASPGPQKNQTP